jgi:hypothetical protein
MLPDGVFSVVAIRNEGNRVQGLHSLYANDATPS